MDTQPNTPLENVSEPLAVDTSVEVQPTVTPSPKSKKNLKIMWILFSVLLLVIGMVAGFFLAREYFPPKNEIVQKEEPDTEEDSTEVSDEEETIAPVDLVEMPEGWLYKNNGKCNVEFPIPPKELQAIGDDRFFWDFPHSGISPILLSKTIAWYDGYQSADALFIEANDFGSGDIPYIVSVFCTDNEDSLTNEEYLYQVNEFFDIYNDETPEEEKEMAASRYTIENMEDVSRWGKNVMDLTISGEYDDSDLKETIQITAFATPEYLYEVRIYNNLENASVESVAKQIFQYLRFN